MNWGPGQQKIPKVESREREKKKEEKTKIKQNKSIRDSGVCTDIFTYVQLSPREIRGNRSEE